MALNIHYMYMLFNVVWAVVLDSWKEMIELQTSHNMKRSNMKSMNKKWNNSQCRMFGNNSTSEWSRCSSFSSFLAIFVHLGLRLSWFKRKTNTRSKVIYFYKRMLRLKTSKTNIQVNSPSGGLFQCGFSRIKVTIDFQLTSWIAGTGQQKFTRCITNMDKNKSVDFV